MTRWGIAIAIGAAACAAHQNTMSGPSSGGGGGGPPAGYCAQGQWETDDLMGGTDTMPVEFCDVAESDCQQVTASWAQYHGVNMSCVPTSVIYCWRYSDASYDGGKSYCHVSMDTCTADQARETGGDHIMPVPPALPCEQITGR